ncbi:unnamed protein product [Rotaria magnacalcarata]|uniref:Uncharacterized protein n=2 Tax=Rotaria magnacalcarata TaxID=392030 RepID=A0A816CZW5_9BILA|nr:unnamed protein product [Rotaria magnacalcarata]CAF2233597.1 unnamed protein product [Rotaria magnacalcarata]CAF4005096.1 unnamed protein product [Rotaria magnacalcarata]
MAASVAPPSLTRTNSNGQLNVYILFQNKMNDNLFIISQDKLPPTLRTGKLILNQRLTFRDEQRRNVEGVIVYMHHNRDNCVSKNKELLDKRDQQQKENNANKPLDVTNVFDSYPSASTITIGNRSSTDVIKKPSNIQKKSKIIQFDMNSTFLPSESLLNDLCDDAEDDDGITSDRIEDSFSSIVRKPNAEDELNTSLDDTIEKSCTIAENNDNNIYLEKVKDLFLKVNQQAKKIKQQTAEIKRLRLTTIEIPKETIIQEYILYLADKVRHQTSSHKYIGNLKNDAINLGLSIDQLNEILKSRGAVTTIARDLFKKIVPEVRRQVDHWNQLEADVLLKEKVLIDFLERYYGALQAIPKQIHISLVGCLRNERNVKKKEDEQLCTPSNDGNESNSIEHI